MKSLDYYKQILRLVEIDKFRYDHDVSRLKHGGLSTFKVFCALGKNEDLIEYFYMLLHEIEKFSFREEKIEMIRQELHNRNLIKGDNKISNTDLKMIVSVLCRDIDFYKEKDYDVLKKLNNLK